MKHMSIDELYIFLKERGKQNRNLSNEDRGDVVDYLFDWNYSWVDDERGYEMKSSFRHNSICYDSFTDSELIDELTALRKELKHSAEDVSEEMISILTTHALEQAVFND